MAKESTSGDTTTLVDNMWDISTALDVIVLPHGYCSGRTNNKKLPPLLSQRCNGCRIESPRRSLARNSNAPLYYSYCLSLLSHALGYGNRAELWNQYVLCYTGPVTAVQHNTPVLDHPLLALSYRAFTPLRCQQQK